ncbi:MAG: hypothetical protein VX642_01015 [Bdellovibrionota bacterium]|nr:hypothetical protein [Bdellovibrionota bacterium]
MKLISISILVALFVSSYASAQTSSYSAEQILRHIVEESRSTDSPLLPSTVNRRLQKEINRTLNYLSPFNSGFFEAKANMDYIEKLNANLNFVTEMGRDSEGMLVVKTTAYAGLKGDRAAYVSREIRNLFSPQQMVLRNVGDYKLILSAYNGKMAIAIEMNYQDVMKKGLSGVPTLKVIHLSGVPESTKNYSSSTKPVKNQEMDLRQMAISYNESTKRGGLLWKSNGGFEYASPFEREVPSTDKELKRKIVYDLQAQSQRCFSSPN